MILGNSSGGRCAAVARSEWASGVGVDIQVGEDERRAMGARGLRNVLTFIEQKERAWCASYSIEIDLSHIRLLHSKSHPRL